MRVLHRNQKTIYYANPSTVSNEKVSGLYTGEPTVTYGTPTAIKIAVSEARGQAGLEINGIREQYTRTMVANRGCPITIDSILWVDTASTNKHDYIVKQVSETLNGLSYVIAKVNQK